MTPTIILTDSAVKKVYALMKEEDNFDLKLRVYITGGGCSGFQYGFAFEEAAQPGDYSLEKQAEDDDEGGSGQVTLLIDPMSYQYLKDAEIDYLEDLQGAQFIIRNPNAKTTCGCGSSFAID